MGLSDKQVAEFQTLYKARFGVSLSKQEAYEQGIKLLRIMQISYRPITREGLARVEARQVSLTNYNKRSSASPL